MTLPLRELLRQLAARHQRTPLSPPMQRTVRAANRFYSDRDRQPSTGMPWWAWLGYVGFGMWGMYPPYWPYGFIRGPYRRRPEDPPRE